MTMILKSKNPIATLKNLLALASVGLLAVSLGCDSQAMSDAASEAEKAAEHASEAAEEMAEGGGEMASEAMAKGKEMASDAAAKGKEWAGKLGEQATAFLGPIREQLGDLEGLKESPEKLKKAVSDLIASIEAKAEGMKLPESVSNGLATVKQKLVSLKEYLEGEYEQAQVNEKVNDIVSSMKSSLGMSGDSE